MRQHWGVFRVACAMLLGLATACASAQATNYPDHPIRLIIPFAPGGSNVIGTLTISGGLASFDRDGATCDELLRKADDALRAGKGADKDVIHLVGPE